MTASFCDNVMPTMSIMSLSPYRFLSLSPQTIIYLSFRTGGYINKVANFIQAPDSPCQVPTSLLDLQSLPISALHNQEFENIYTSTIPSVGFNKIQTQVFQVLYMSDENVFIGAPTGSGKTVCAEFALLRLWSKREQPRAVCILPFQEMVDMRVEEWKRKFGNVQGGKEVLALTGETSADLRLLERADVVICTPNKVGFVVFRNIVFQIDFFL